MSLSEQVRTSQAGDVYLPGNTASGMYEYDLNGNLTKDSRKGLEYKYNRLNLLEEVWKDGEMKAQYNYLSDGTKVSVRDGSGKNGYDYVGSVVYKVVDGCREFDRAVIGDVHFTNEGVRYALTDQLGSVRALIDEDGNVVQQNDYYPFGAKVVRDDYVNADDNRFLFSGKESQELLDLNAYDFGARMYDASLGRWNTVDPLGEKYVNLSPYNYCVNNPLVYVDPNGEDAMITIEGNVITISLNIVLYGEAVNADIARLYEMFLYSRWGNITTFMNSDIEYKIEWDINVLYDAELKHGDEDKFDFNGVNNYMEVIYRVTTEERSYVQADNYHIGVIYRNRNDRDGSLSKYSMAHEMGHLLGLHDRYNSSGAATSEKYEGNIMYEVDGIVTPLNMKGILNSSLAKQHILDGQRQELERILDKSLKPEKGIYYINKHNREYK